MNKLFVLDTNVLLYDADSIFSFEDNDIIIPLIVLEELDSKKNRHDEVGKNARQAARNLDDLRLKSNLHSGVKLDNGGILKILSQEDVEDKNVDIPVEIQGSKTDHVIIRMAKYIEHKENRKVVLVTKDINVRVVCDVVGVSCEDYRKHRVLKSVSGLYSGVQRLEISQEDIDKFYESGKINLSKTSVDTSQFKPNQFLVMKDNESGQGSAIAKFSSSKKPIYPIIDIKHAWELRPRNKEQKFALDLLFDDRIKIVTLTGKAGCGKTLLAVAAGLEQVIEQKKYDRLIVTRPIVSVGKEIGFLPGTLEEKMAPWIAPIRDQLSFLFKGENGDQTLEWMLEKKTIEVEAISFIRGRSIPNSFMIIDEAQNLSVHELKTIITRVGENTKIILTGDLEQIDHDYLDSVSNGLAYCVEKFKDHAIAGHITLIKGERSKLASLAAEIL
jgi:PhoH-like ATPase